MLAAMILAHLVGDYLLQTDRIARWKAQALAGVAVHAAIVTAVTVLFALAVDWRWWPWALGIGAAHFVIDAIRLRLGSSFNALALFLLDQAAHLSVIALALHWSGAAQLALPPGDWLHDAQLSTLVIAYLLITLPAWVLIEFLAAAWVRGAAPDFAQASNKYLSSLERALVTTFVLLGQWLLVVLVAAPRLVFEQRHSQSSERGSLQLAQWLLSLTLAVALGLGLRYGLGV